MEAYQKSIQSKSPKTSTWLTDVLDSITEPVLLVDEDGFIEGMNAAFVEKWHEVAVELKRKSLASFSFPIAFACEALSTKGTFTESFLLEHEGEEIHFIVEFVKAKRGAIIKFLEVGQDHRWSLIRKHATRNNRDILESYNRIQNLVDSLPNTCLYRFVVKPNGDFYFPYISTSIVKILGVTAEQVLQDSNFLFNAVHPEDAHRLQEMRKYQVLSLTARDFQYRYQATDGSFKWMNIRANPHKTEDGTIVWNGFILDIDKQKKLELASQQKDAKIQNLVDNLPDGIIYQVVFKEGNYYIPYVGLSVFDMLGFTAAEVIANPYLVVDRFHPEDVDAIRAKQWQCKNNLEPYDIEYRQGTKWGEYKWVHTRGRPRKMEDGNIIWDCTSLDIHHRKMAEAEIQNSEKRFRGILENMVAGVIQTDCEGKINFCNMGTREILGLEIDKIDNNYFSLKEQLIPYDLDGNVMDEQDLPVAVTLRNKVAVKNFRHGIKKEKGKIQWLSVNSAPVLNATSVLQGAVVSFVDVTERVTQETEIQKLALIAQHTDNNIIITDTKGKIEWVNKAFVVTSGYSIDEVRGKSPGSFLMGPESDPIARTKMMTSLNKGEPVRTELLNYNKSGKKYWVDMNIWPVFDSNGRVTHYVSLDVNVTQLKLSEEKFATAFNLSPDLMFIVRERDSMIIDVNTNIEKMMGLPCEHFLNKTVPSTINWRDGEAGKKFLAEYELNGNATAETTIPDKDGNNLYVVVRSTRITLDSELHRLTIVRDITSRKKAELELAKSEKLFRNLVNELSVGVIMWGADSKIITSNKAALELLGISESDLSDEPISEIERSAVLEDGTPIAPHDLPMSLALKTKKASKDSVIGLFTIKSQRFIWLLVNAVPFLKEDGEVDYVICSYTDITHQKESEAKLAMTTRLYQSLVNTQSSFLVRKNLEGYYTFVNSAFCKHFGIDEDEVLGKHCYDFLIAEDQIECYKATEKVIKDPSKVSRVQLRVAHRRNGAIYWTDWEFMALTDSHGNITEIQCVGLDVTEIKRAAEKLQLSEANLSSIINNTSMLVWSVDRDYRLMTINTTCQQTLDEVHQYRFLPGQRMVPLLNKETDSIETIDLWMARYDRAFLGEAFKVGEWIGDRYYEFSLNSIIEDKNVIGVSVFGDDITERIQQEQLLIQLNKKMGEMKLLSLQTAMNPHFIFNALNSIQYFISKNDRLNAINYLAKFSKLIRGILSGSTQAKIRLVDEIEVLTHYIQIEQVRFEGKFNFQFDVDEELNLHVIEIPPFLIQPYVENAILHGLCHKNSLGLLVIRIRPDQKRILIEIEDDGVGREAAALLRTLNFTWHKSLGVKLTEERLNLINGKDKVSFETIDLRDSENKPSGTRVRIWI